VTGPKRTVVTVLTAHQLADHVAVAALRMPEVYARLDGLKPIEKAVLLVGLLKGVCQSMETDAATFLAFLDHAVEKGGKPPEEVPCG
jgi:hypothetical protein